MDKVIEFWAIIAQKSLGSEMVVSLNYRLESNEEEEAEPLGSPLYDGANELPHHHHRQCPLHHNHMQPSWNGEIQSNFQIYCCHELPMTKWHPDPCNPNHERSRVV